MEEKEELTLKDILQIIQEYKAYLLPKWRIFVISGFVGAVLGLCISILKKPKYVGVLTFVIDEENKMGAIASLASSFGVGKLEQSLSGPDNVLQFLTSRSLVEKTLLRSVDEDGYKDRTYADLYIKANELDVAWEGDSILKDIQYKVGDNRSDFSREQDSILYFIYDRIVDKRKELTVEQVSIKSSFIGITVVSKSEVFSKNFPIELTKVVSEYYTEIKTQRVKQSVTILEHQVDSIKLGLYTHMGEAASSLDQVFGLNPAMLTQKVSSSKQQAQVQISLVALQELIKHLEFAKIRLLDNSVSFNLVDTPVYPLEVKEITILKGVFGGSFLSSLLVMVFLVLRKLFLAALD